MVDGEVASVPNRGRSGGGRAGRRICVMLTGGVSDVARILIIDDNETMREGLAATVRRMGHEALVAANGAEGIQQMKRRGADFVVTDLKMEGAGGLEVLK